MEKGCNRFLDAPFLGGRSLYAVGNREPLTKARGTEYERAEASRR